MDQILQKLQVNSNLTLHLIEISTNQIIVHKINSNNNMQDFTQHSNTLITRKITLLMGRYQKIKRQIFQLKIKDKRLYNIEVKAQWAKDSKVSSNLSIWFMMILNQQGLEEECKGNSKLEKKMTCNNNWSLLLIWIKMSLIIF